MQRKEVTTTTFSVLNDFATIITTERYTNGKTNLTLPSENLRLYSSSLPTEFTSKSAASSVLFPSLQDQRKNVKNQFAVLNAILEVKKIKLSILRINSTLGRQTNRERKNTVTNNFILNGMLREEFPIYIFNHCEEKMREDDKKIEDMTT